MGPSVLCHLGGPVDPLAAPFRGSPEMVQTIPIGGRFLGCSFLSDGADRGRVLDRFSLPLGRCRMDLSTTIAGGGGGAWKIEGEVGAWDLATEAVGRLVDALRGGIGRRSSRGRRRGCRRR